MSPASVSSLGAEDGSCLVHTLPPAMPTLTVGTPRAPFAAPMPQVLMRVATGASRDQPLGLPSGWSAVIRIRAGGFASDSGSSSYTTQVGHAAGVACTPTVCSGNCSCAR